MLRRVDRKSSTNFKFQLQSVVLPEKHESTNFSRSSYQPEEKNDDHDNDDKDDDDGYTCKVYLHKQHSSSFIHSSCIN